MSRSRLLEGIDGVFVLKPSGAIHAALYTLRAAVAREIDVEAADDVIHAAEAELIAHLARRSTS